MEYVSWLDSKICEMAKHHPRWGILIRKRLIWLIRKFRKEIETNIHIIYVTLEKPLQPDLLAHLVSSIFIIFPSFFVFFLYVIIFVELLCSYNKAYQHGIPLLFCEKMVTTGFKLFTRCMGLPSVGFLTLSKSPICWVFSFHRVFFSDPWQNTFLPSARSKALGKQRVSSSGTIL